LETSYKVLVTKQILLFNDTINTKYID